MITIDLYINFDKSINTFTFLDNSRVENASDLSNITEWTIYFKTPEGYEITKNVIEYVYSEIRESYEINKIIATDLNLVYFKDGIYNVTYTINGIKKDIQFILYGIIEKTLNTLITETNYQVEVNDYDIEYTGISANTKGDLEKINLANSLLLELKNVSDNDKANEIITELNLLLGIIN